jgi:hypothetical protein
VKGEKERKKTNPFTLFFSNLTDEPKLPSVCHSNTEMSESIPFPFVSSSREHADEKGFIKNLRRLVAIPGVCEWTSANGIDAFKFPTKGLVSQSMSEAGFKTDKFASLMRQMNSYSFKYSSPHQAKIEPGVGGYWYHTQGMFCQNGSRDWEVLKVCPI